MWTGTGKQKTKMKAMRKEIIYTQSDSYLTVFGLFPISFLLSSEILSNKVEFTLLPTDKMALLSSTAAFKNRTNNDWKQ